MTAASLLGRRRPALVVALLPALVGFDYGTTILVDDQTEIEELYYNGELDDAELRDQLIGLLENPLDLNLATRDELFLLPELTYPQVDQIIAQRNTEPFKSWRGLNDIVGPQIARQIRPFVVVAGETDSREVRGKASLRVLDRLEDNDPTLVYIKNRTSVGTHIDGGFIVAEQDGLRGVEYIDDGATFEDMGATVSLERIYLSYKEANWSVIAGHYMAGFGQRLTFDVTDKVRPFGVYHDLNIYEDYQDFDSYRVGRRLFGVAGSWKTYLGEGTTSLHITPFISASSHDVFYTYVDPRELPGKAAYEDEIGEAIYPRLPDLYREDLGGINASVFWNPRVHVGVTGWGGRTVKQYDFSFTNLAIPNRDVFGAAGIDGQWGRGVIDLYGEAAVTDIGGFAGRSEGVLLLPGLEASLAYRYYGTDWDNPHSRGRAQPDQLGYLSGLTADDISGGKRDSDERGPQMTLVYSPTPWGKIRLKGDVWERMSLERWDAYGEARLDLDPTSWLGIDVLANIRDKDISLGGREQNYTDEDDEIAHGQRGGVGAGVKVFPVSSLYVQVFGKQNYEDVTLSTRPEYDERYQRDAYVWTKVVWDISDNYTLTARYRYTIDRRERQEEWDGTEDITWIAEDTAYAQLRVRLPAGITAQARYDVVNDLDERIKFAEGQSDDPPELVQQFKLSLDIRY